MRCAIKLLLAVVTLGSFGAVFIPAFLIRPFVAQSHRGITVSYALRSSSPAITLATLIVGAFLIVILWRSSRSVWGKTLLGAALVFLAGMVFLSRQNHFEWMFHPIPQPGWVGISKTDHVEDSDMVLGISIGNEARAYPVRIIAYHHVVNDVVGSQPLAVTY